MVERRKRFGSNSSNKLFRRVGNSSIPKLISLGRRLESLIMRFRCLEYSSFRKWKKIKSFFHLSKWWLILEFKTIYKAFKPMSMQCLGWTICLPLAVLDYFMTRLGVITSHCKNCLNSRFFLEYLNTRASFIPVKYKQE